MAVAEMPGDPDQMLRIGTPDLGQRFRRGDDLDQPVIVEHQRVATSQHGCVFQVEQKLKADPAMRGLVMFSMNTARTFSLLI